MTEDEMADYFRRNDARVILDLAWTKFLPIPEMREYHDTLSTFSASIPTWCSAIGSSSIRGRARKPPANSSARIDAAPGFVGLAVSGQGVGVPAADPLWDPFYKLSIDAGLPVMIMTGLTGIGQGLPGATACARRRPSAAHRSRRRAFPRCASWRRDRPIPGRTR